MKDKYLNIVSELKLERDFEYLLNCRLTGYILKYNLQGFIN